MKATMPKDGDDEDLLDGSDLDEDGDIPSDFSAAMASDEDEDLVFDEHDITDGESERGAANASAAEDQDEEEVDSDEGLSLVEGSDNEDLIPLDEIPDGLIAYNGSDDEAGVEDEEEWQGISSEKPRKRKRGTEEKGSKRKKSRSLPTFASYEDYAKMIEDGPEDDI